MDQIKNKLDTETLSKIGKSALLLIGGFIAGDGGISLLQYITSTELGVWRVPAVLGATFIINTVREYMKGVKK
jgi:hypothetical protein